MAAINYAEQYFKALSQAFPYVLNFGALYSTPNNNLYKPVDAKTIKIPRILVTGRVDGNRDAITGISRRHDNDWEIKTLSNHRKWDTLIHPVDVNQSNQIMTITNATKVMNEEQKFPEMDAYCISKIYTDWVALGKEAVTTTLTKDNILEIFDTMMASMDEARVPQAGRLLYVTPQVNRLLKNATGLLRNISVDVGGEGIINRLISRLDEVQKIIVPSELMKTVFDFTTGWAAGATAKQINMLLIHPLSVLTPVIYSFAQLDEPSALSEGKWVYFEESFEDVFILNQKANGIMFHTEA